MNIHLTVNGIVHDIDIAAGELLRTTLRRLRYFSVKHGDETGESGADAVLLAPKTTTDSILPPGAYRLVNAGIMLFSSII